MACTTCPGRTRVAPPPASAIRSSTESTAASDNSVSPTVTRRPTSSSVWGVVTTRSDFEVAEIARHADQAGDQALAYRYALLAADAAVRRCAYDEALS